VDGGVSATRAAQNQSLYRSVNEQIKTVNEVFEELVDASGEWICECADTDCTIRVLATMDEYEAVRENPRAFIVFPGHVYPEVERILAENERYVTVEKLDDGGQLAEALDKRQTDGAT